MLYQTCIVLVMECSQLKKKTILPSTPITPSSSLLLDERIVQYIRYVQIEIFHWHNIREYSISIRLIHFFFRKFILLAAEKEIWFLCNEWKEVCITNHSNNIYLSYQLIGGLDSQCGPHNFSPLIISTCILHTFLIFCS